jgi:hypothetical protein
MKYFRFTITDLGDLSYFETWDIEAANMDDARDKGFAHAFIAGWTYADSRSTIVETNADGAYI